MHELVYALRVIRGRPGFSAVVVLTLALGIGANTAIFSFVNALLVRPFPFRDPDRLVSLYTETAAGRGRVASREIEDLRERATLFEGFAAYSGAGLYSVSRDGGGEQVRSTYATRELFAVLGAEPILGKPWDAADDRRLSPVVVLGHGLWRTRFGSDPSIVGKQILLDAAPYTVTGVAPPGFGFPSEAVLFRSWGIDPDLRFYQDRDRRGAMVVARLKPGVTVEHARAELDAIGRRLAADFPATNEKVRFGLVALREVYVGDVRRYVLLLLGAVGLVLLIACVNVVNLMLSRAAARGREIAIRAALGAGRGAIVRQLLAESVLLALAGG
ncbi:MAG: ABC transporter permease, partial [Bryobacteraceae bacterium]